ncbi:MAG: hypothetical protein JWQ42_1144, partial [Edaphobacter sp.]|nr:hypothetical protein [Edaphobacter sp.]
WEALRVSVHCAVRLFGPRTEYVICVNTVGLESAQQRAGVLPEYVCWLEVSSADVPSFLLPHLGQAMAEGVGWKLVPTRIFPDAYELSRRERLPYAYRENHEPALPRGTEPRIRLTGQPLVAWWVHRRAQCGKQASLTFSAEEWESVRALTPAEAFASRSNEGAVFFKRRPRQRARVSPWSYALML